MKSFAKTLKDISFFSYFSKVDPEIKKYLALKKVNSIPVIVTFKRCYDAEKESRLKRAGFKIKYHLPFLNGVTGKIRADSFDSIRFLVVIDKIYFDGIACLMGSTDNKEQYRETSSADALHLSGKGVTVAFIDSGVYPHPDLILPRNRIAAFKDFVNGIDYPYDDNGHGTACIGAAFGASVDGSFRSVAYDCNIVCSKAFNSLGYGLFSDILAAMQWIYEIKEKHNIRILVLPFGSCCVQRHFDIISLAVERLWKSGLFVCTCTGNLGPYEGSITSPGNCPSSFTTGACADSGGSVRVAYFSGRGPVEGKVEKPDAVMRGYKVTGLNADTSYIPGSGHTPGTKLKLRHYTEISGSSAAASMVAASAALLYQKKPGLSPEDMKSALKRLCTSINELKTAQGAGMIDMKKIEEFQ